MRPRNKVSQAGVELIERFEGYRARAARLSDGRWTIGFGHTRSAREGAEVSREDARILLKYVDLPPVEDAIHELVSTPLAQNQYDALVAFVFNVGTDAFRSSEVLARLNEGRLTEAACALELWRRAEVAGDPVVLDALIRRRAAEKALFLTPPEGFAPTPSPLVRPELDARAAEALPKRRPVEHEAPMSGEAAEVRLVAPFEVEPAFETPTAFAPEPAETGEALPALEAPSEVEEEAPTAWTAQVVNFAAPAAEAEEAPTAWTVEPDAAPPVAGEEPTAWAAEPEEGVEAVAEPAPEQAPEPEAEEAPTAWTVAPEPAAEASASEPEAAAEAVETAPEPQPASGAQEPAAAAPAAVEPAAEPVETAAPSTPEPPAAEPKFAVIPGPPARTIPAAERPVTRPVYANYGPMAFAVMPPAARAAEPATAPEREGERSEEAGEPADVEPHPAPASQVQTSAPEAQVLAEAAAAPVVTAEAPAPPPLVLTSPPADWDDRGGVSPAMVAAMPAEADELETPLFDEGWDGPSALSGRIVRHEPVAEPERAAKRPAATAPYVLMGLIGFVALAGALFAFWRGRAPGMGGDPTLLEWSLALIGAALVGISVYFLFKRLGGAED